ncbi:MAG: CDC27 family protein [Paludibacter sp.]|nr:CDC27 family protein [Paludibacter sp.]
MKKIWLLIFLSVAIVLQSQNKQITNALNNFNYQLAIKLIESSEPGIEMDILKAQCYINLYKYDSAIKLLENIVKADSLNIQAVSNLADCYESTGNYKKSTILFNKCVLTKPESNFFHLRYINSLFKLKEWDKTIIEINNHLRKDSVKVLYGLLGDCYWQNDAIDSAIVYYKKGINVNPEDYNLVSKLARIYLQNQNPTELINCTNDYIAIDSTNRAINQYNGIGYCFDQQFKKAIYRLRKLYDEGDKSYSTNYYLGSSYFGLQDYFGAVDHLSEAYKQDSSNVNLLFYLGRSSILIGKFDNGIAVLKRGIDVMTPKDSVLYNFHSNLALGYNRDKQYKEAIKNYELCIKFNPESKLTLYSIATIYDYSLKNQKQAMKYYNLFLSSFPAEPESEAKKEEFMNELSGTYYSAVKNRIEELKTEQFFKK